MPFPEKSKGGTLPALEENPEQRALFDEYVAMGRNRSLEKLQAHTERTIQTIQRWSSRFGWVRRADLKDRELLENGLESARDHINNKKLALAIINKMIKDVAVIDEKGELVGTTVQAKNVYDIKTLIEIKDIILGVDKKDTSPKGGNTNIDKAIFIIKK